MVTPSVDVDEADPTYMVARWSDGDPESSGSGAGAASANLTGGRWRLHLDRNDLHVAAAARLLGALADRAAASDAPVEWWVEATGDDHEEIARLAGLVCDRELLQMRRGLPLATHSTIAVRPFEPNRDEDDWLSVNNAAFHWHEDQGDWDRPRLDRRLTEPWVDLDGFLVHERDGRLAGFCWTKEHHDTVPTMGEIYVIAVDPVFHGHGLGRELTLAGLDHLAARGLPLAMLYVESANESAVALYRSLGFEVHHRDRRYVRDQPVLTPKSEPTA